MIAKDLFVNGIINIDINGNINEHGYLGLDCSLELC